MIRTLSSAGSFRVRMQAAFALSHRAPAPRTLEALRRALGDSHPAVREASASALASLTGRTRETPSPRAPAKFYVRIGKPTTEAKLSASVLRSLELELERAVQAIEGVRIAPQDEDSQDVSRVLSRDALVGCFLESAVRRVDVRPDGTMRVEVAIIVATYPGRDIRAMLTGSASGPVGGSHEQAKLTLAQHAFGSALRRLPQVLDTSRLQASAGRQARR